MSKFLSLILAAILLAAGPALAGGVSLTTEVFKETEVRTAGGGASMGLKPAGHVVPGEQVIYVLTYRNGAAVASDAVVVTNPLPANVTYAGPGDSTPPEVSTDGRVFDQLSKLMVKRSDGSFAPARMADVTALRWKLAEAVPAGGEARLSFRARLK